MYSGLQHFTNLQGLQIGTLNHGAGAVLELKGINTLGVVNTEPGSEIMLEDNEDGAGSSITDFMHGGSLNSVGNHQVGTFTTTAGSKILSHGQRTPGSAAPAQEAAPQEDAPEDEGEEGEEGEEEEYEEEEEGELMNLQGFRDLMKRHAGEAYAIGQKKWGAAKNSFKDSVSKWEL